MRDTLACEARLVAAAGAVGAGSQKIWEIIHPTGYG
jgi:hypothetical protein